jgi:hypothetical protein
MELGTLCRSSPGASSCLLHSSVTSTRILYFPCTEMANKDQIFLIARVRTSSSSNAKQRKCIGAFHHESFYGRLPGPLNDCLRFFDLLFNPLIRVPCVKRSIWSAGTNSPA